MGLNITMLSIISPSLEANSPHNSSLIVLDLQFFNQKKNKKAASKNLLFLCKRFKKCCSFCLNIYKFSYRWSKRMTSLFLVFWFVSLLVMSYIGLTLITMPTISVHYILIKKIFVCKKSYRTQVWWEKHLPINLCSLEKLSTSWKFTKGFDLL